MTNTSSGKKKRVVIIVDDDNDLVQLLTFAFDSEGFSTHGINSGLEAIKFFKNEKNGDDICLLILDRILPDMDGLNILKKLPENFINKTPVLILSVLSSENEVRGGLMEGAVDYIAKPFNLPILMVKALALIDRYSNIPK